MLTTKSLTSAVFTRTSDLNLIRYQVGRLYNSISNLFFLVPLNDQTDAVATSESQGTLQKDTSRSTATWTDSKQYEHLKKIKSLALFGRLFLKEAYKKLVPQNKNKKIKVVIQQKIEDSQEDLEVDESSIFNF